MINTLTMSFVGARGTWNALTIAVAAIATCKGIRLPNLWSATQLQLGYQMGFVKRAGAGALLHYLHLPIQHYLMFAAFSFVILIAAVALFVPFVRDNAVTDESVALTPIFASSFAVPYFAHLVGYLDLILLTMALALLLLPRSRWRLILDFGFCLGAGRTRAQRGCRPPRARSSLWGALFEPCR